MLVAIMCLDKPNHLDLRMATRPAHLEWLKANMPTGEYVGPLLGDDGEGFQGSLYILEFESVAAARGWIKDEPYYKANLFESVIMRSSRNILPMG
jgi:uncharacterized protein YciI